MVQMFTLQNMVTIGLIEILFQVLQAQSRAELLLLLLQRLQVRNTDCTL